MQRYNNLPDNLNNISEVSGYILLKLNFSVNDIRYSC